jgi:hypothetical protein
MTKPRRNLVFVHSQVRTVLIFVLYYFLWVDFFPFLESLRIRLAMEPYGTAAITQYPLNLADDWLRKRQGLALPVLPPTTHEARKYFFHQDSGVF